MIDEKGEQKGIVDFQSALQSSKEKQLDLLLLSDKSDPPVCKLVNYGQFMYQQKKKDRSARRTAQVTKEVKMSPKISIHDFQVRVNRSIEFLKKRYKIKLSIFFKGREIMHKDLGVKVAKDYLDAIKEYGTIDNELMTAGRNLIAIITPK